MDLKEKDEGRKRGSKKGGEKNWWQNGKGESKNEEGKRPQEGV